VAGGCGAWYATIAKNGVSPGVDVMNVSARRVRTRVEYSDGSSSYVTTLPSPSVASSSA
jgi:hypothetical protein